MRKAIIAVAPLAILFANPALGQENDATGTELVDHTAYAAIFDALQGGLDSELVIENQLEVIRSLWAQDPTMAQMEAQHPGLFDALLAAARPVLTRQNEEIAVEYRPKFLAALANVLTPAEAETIAQFYRSPIGIKMMRSLSANMDSRASIEGGLKTGEIAIADVESDIEKGAEKVMDGLTTSEEKDLARILSSDPVYLKFPALQSAVMPVRAQMERESMTPQRQREIEQTIAMAAQQHISAQ